MAQPGLDEDVKNALLALLSSIETEDEYLRLQQQRQFKKNNLFWHGFQYLFWSDLDADWRIPTHQEMADISAREETRYIFDYVINHFKAHGESIIAALSTDIPDVRFGPRDAQDPTDRRAVDAANNTIDLIQKWNRAKLLIINALFYLTTEGFVASYTYHRKDESYGTIKIPQYDTRNEADESQLQCANCGYKEPAESSPPLSPSPTPDYSNIPNDAPPPGAPPMPPPGAPPDMSSGQPPGQPPGVQAPPGKPCPTCGQPMDHPMQMVPFLSGEKPIPKGREVIEIYGPLNVRIPSYVNKLADGGYLVQYVDVDPALLKGTFEDQAEDIDSDSGQNYERLMRQSSLSMDGYQLNIKLATFKRVWLRPWMIHRLDNGMEDVKAKIKKQFPHGIYFGVNGQTLLEFRDETMDAHWTITKAGPSKGVHADPLLQGEVQLQEIRNNLVNMFVMQVEYGVPATYADSEVFDFEGQGKQEIAPGYIYPVTPRPGQTIDQAFYTERTSTLSKEATQLLEAITEDEQFVNGSYPSIFGGAGGGSKTLGEYEKSRAFALQRLGLVYYFINVWWAETGDKAVRSFIAHQIDDEPVTSPTTGGDFQTKWIRKADLKGSFERLEPEASSDFPVSFSQKRQLIMTLMQLNNPQINEVLFSPTNIGVVKNYVGLPEIQIPSDVQRRKQVREIIQLIGLEPLETGDGDVLSSVPVEPDIDEHPVHIDELTIFLCSDTGQDLKQNNPQGYANCLAHLIEHKKFMMAMMPPPGPPPMHPNGPGPV